MDFFLWRITALMSTFRSTLGSLTTYTQPRTRTALVVVTAISSIFVFSVPALADCWVAETGVGGHAVVPRETLPDTYPSSESALTAVTQHVVNQVLGVQRCIVELPDTSHPSEIISSYETANNACEPISGGPPTVCTRSIGFRGSSGYYCQAGSSVLFTQIQVRRFLPGDLPCRGTLTLKLSRPDDSSEDNTVLDKIEPAKEAMLVAKVYDQNNQLVPNVGVKLVLEAKQNSGGHHHPDDTVAVRTGTMNGQQIFTGNTGPSGLQFSYRAPSVSGDYKIVASCTDGKNCTQDGPDTVWVGVKGLEPIVPASDSASGPLYVLIGQDNYHPDNHYLTPKANGRLQQLASRYRERFPNDPPLYLNDASLERGGLFDIYYDYADKYGVRHERNAEGWWTPPHAEHRKGTVIDVRANQAAGAVPSRNHQILMDLARDIGVDAGLHSPGTANQHFHIRLMGVAE
jgi:hypothetical protein